MIVCIGNERNAQLHGMRCIRHCHEPTIILEAVASQDLWIWHAFFGMLGSINDIDVLDRSPIFAALAEGRTAPVNYTINGHNIQWDTI